MAGITSDLAKKNPETTQRPPAGDLRTISAGTTLLAHTVYPSDYVQKNWRTQGPQRQNKSHE